MAGSQNTMATGGPAEAARAEALAQFFDRLSQRLLVWSLSLVHEPESSQAAPTPQPQPLVTDGICWR